MTSKAKHTVCTCIAIRRMTINGILEEIEFCPMHEAAPAMLEALEAAVYILKQNNPLANKLRGQPWYTKAEAAIKAAKGEQ
mgnify:FL=1